MKDDTRHNEILKKELKSLRQKFSKLEKLEIEHKKNSTALKEKEKRYREIFENANDGIILHDTEGKIIDVNSTMYKRLGFTKDEMLKMSLSALVTPEYREKIKERMKTLEDKGVAIFVSEDRRKDGTKMPVEVSARYVIQDGKKIIQSVVRDINERKIAEELILTGLKEKELILKELRHRIKNIIPIISNLMAIKSRKIVNQNMSIISDIWQDYLEIFILIHDKIYRSKNLAQIDISNLSRFLITVLITKRKATIKNVYIERDINNIFLTVLQAIPCCLIIYELLWNSLKYAFPGNREGKILLSLTQKKNRKYELIVKDDGIGLPKNFDMNTAKTFGMKIVSDLVNELNGTLKLRKTKGTEFEITF